jgi:hypothetical protein
VLSVLTDGKAGIHQPAYYRQRAAPEAPSKKNTSDLNRGFLSISLVLAISIPILFIRCDVNVRLASGSSSFKFKVIP